MWIIALHCDGCDERLDPSGASLDGLPDAEEALAEAARGVPRGLPARVRATLTYLEACHARIRFAAGRLRWERVDAPDDGERWYCPTCRLARDRETLVAARK
jgi:hypothetical protein